MPATGLQGGCWLVKATDKMNEFDRLVEIVATLRSPEGCPWDREQDHESLKHYLLEEVYEVLEAADAGVDEKLCGELGDVLLMVVMYAQIGAEQNGFNISDVIARITDKLIYRHPHVFGDIKVADSDEVVDNWEQLKQHEAGTGQRESALDGIPRSLPALQQAQELQKKAARVGFDWDSIEGPWRKLFEEIEELQEAADNGADEAVAHELGDLLIAVVNLARFLGVYAEDALRAGNRRFEQRFRQVEQQAAATGRELSEMTLEELDELWEQAKTSQKK